MIPILYKIGNQWAKGEIDIATEHVCSNAINTLIDLINQQNSKRISKNNYITRPIIVSTPEGELHSIGCKMIESLLLEKGYKIYNTTSSLPTNSIQSYLNNTNSALLIISVTLQENLNSTIRFVQQVRKSSNIPIIVGGNAIESASKSQIKLLEQIEKVYLNLDKLDDIIIHIKLLMNT